MRILLVSNSYPLAPSASSIVAFSVRQMALALTRVGAEVCVLTPDRLGEKQSEPGISVRWFPWSGRGEAALIKLRITRPTGLWHAMSLFVSGRRAVLEACRQFSPDICLAAWALPSGYFARYAKRCLGIPYAVWCLGSDIHTWARKPLFGGMIRRVLRDADLLYADGFELGRDVTTICQRSCDFLATARTFGCLTPEVPALESEKTHFLFVGRWERVKGLDVLLDAWRLLVAKGAAKNAVLHVTGHGEGLKDCVERALRDGSMEDSVRVAGWVSDAQLAGLYRACDCVVIPSRKESIPVVISESLQAETPLIVTDVGDMGELVRRYDLGRVVPPDSPIALHEALAEFVNHGHRLIPTKVRDARELFDTDCAVRTFLTDAHRVLGSMNTAMSPSAVRGGPR